MKEETFSQVRLFFGIMGLTWCFNKLTADQTIHPLFRAWLFCELFVRLTFLACASKTRTIVVMNDKDLLENMRAADVLIPSKLIDARKKRGRHNANGQ